MQTPLEKRPCAHWFARITWALLAYNIAVILWGAWVRISFSGDGCLESWPLCDGQFIPTAASKAQWIEWSHRASTGVFGIWSASLFLWSRSLFPKKHLAKRFSLAMLLLTLSEALIGALLVKLGLVTDNESIARAWAMGVHQLNSLALTGSIFLVAKSSLSNRMYFDRRFVGVTIFFAMVAFTGAIAALAGTLFPSAHLISGVLADFDANSHILVRLRLSHPLLASCFCAGVFLWLTRWKNCKSVFVLKTFLLIAFVFGAATLLSLSPVWMKLTHLAIAHLFFLATIEAATSVATASLKNAKAA